MYNIFYCSPYLAVVRAKSARPRTGSAGPNKSRPQRAKTAGTERSRAMMDKTANTGVWPPPVSWPANRTPTPISPAPHPPAGDVYVYSPDAAMDYSLTGVKLARPKSVSTVHTVTFKECNPTLN